MSNQNIKRKCIAARHPCRFGRSNPRTKFVRNLCAPSIDPHRARQGPRRDDLIYQKAVAQESTSELGILRQAFRIAERPTGLERAMSAMIEPRWIAIGARDRHAILR